MEESKSIKKGKAGTLNFIIPVTGCLTYEQAYQILVLITWVKVFRVIPEFRFLRQVSLKVLIVADFDSFSD